LQPRIILSHLRAFGKCFSEKRTNFLFYFLCFVKERIFCARCTISALFAGGKLRPLPFAASVWAVLSLLYIYNKKQRRRFRRKQALQMPFAFTTPPVKKPIGKIRRFSRLANLK
jgi:hypothetical protein